MRQKEAAVLAEVRRLDAQQAVVELSKAVAAMAP